jgi:hypothetical protein
MRRIDKLNGLKAWWNRLCKPQYIIKISAEELKAECISEYENTGSVEIRHYQSKDGCIHNFWK